MNGLSKMETLDKIIVKELQEIVNELNLFPTQTKLQELKRNSLVSKIRASGNGIGYYAKLLGFEPKRKRWSRHRVIEEMRLVWANFGRCPTFGELYDANKGELAREITFISQKTLLAEFGDEIKILFNAKWSDKLIIKELRKVGIEVGKTPTQSMLRKCGRSDIEKAITKTGKEFNYFVQLAGFEPSQKSKKYWKCFDNLSKEITSIIIDGRFPTSNEIRYNLGGHAEHALAYYGGINKVAERMGYSLKHFNKTTDGHYVHSYYEYIVDEFLHKRNIQHEVNGFIDKNLSYYKYDFKINDWFVEIWGFKDRTNSEIAIKYQEKRRCKEQFYKNNNLGLISIEHNIFHQPLANIEKSLEDIFIKYGII